MFTVSGEIDGQVAAIVWLDDGELDGDAFAIARVLELAATKTHVWVTPTGPHYIAAVDAGDEAALATILSVFDDRGQVHVLGDPPKINVDVPKGATP